MLANRRMAKMTVLDQQRLSTSIARIIGISTTAHGLRKIHMRTQADPVAYHAVLSSCPRR